jgi:hypothetical protein
MKDEDDAGHASRSNGLLHVKASRLGFPNLASRPAEGRRWVVHMTSLMRLCRVQSKDGRVDAMSCIRPCYTYFVIFIVLDHMGNLFF